VELSGLTSKLSKLSALSFGQSTNVIGLDIGTSAVKAVEVEESKGTYSLKNFGVVPVPKEAIVNGALADREAVIASIAQLVKDLGIKTKSVVASISGHPVIIKKIAMPVATDEEVSESIQFEAEQYIPFDLDEVNLDFQVLGAHEDKADQMNVMLVAAKKAMINEYTTAIADAGLRMVILDIDVFALENMFTINYPAEESEYVALVDVGASVINMNILKGGTSAFTRDVFLGGNQITEDIQNQLSISFEEAEQLKKGEGGSEAQREGVDNIVATGCTSIATEIQRTIDFFTSTTYGEVSKVYVSGGGAKMEGLKSILEERVGMPAEIINPLNSVHVDARQFDAAYLAEMAPLAAVGVGLAIRRLGD
jgi:type IV pilus assembly protein PilM